MVKPILKKLTSSGKTSLDLDRGWDEQSFSTKDNVKGGRDVNFQFPARDAIGMRSTSNSGTTTPLAGMPEVGGLHDTSARGGSHGRSSHARNTSWTSMGSANRHNFTHPFQQTPNQHTPLGHALETDEEGLDAPGRGGGAAYSHYTHHTPTYSGGAASITPATGGGLRRPSLVSQRSNSLADITNTSGNIAPPPRAQTLQHNGARPIWTSSSSRGNSTLYTSYSQSDLRLASCIVDSPRPSISASHMSPIRSSLDNMGFRLRSNSEVVAVDGGIREARRKFQEHERMKDEKYEAEQNRKRERKDTKEAARLEKAARKNTFSSDKGGRPSTSRARTPTLTSQHGSSSRHASPLRGLARNRTASSSLSLSQQAGMNEKDMHFLSSSYDNAGQGRTPTTEGPQDLDDVHFRSPRRSAKKKTQTYWQAFVLWLRTRLLQLERR